MNLAKILSLFPFTVNVFGKKRDLIVRVGDFFYTNNRLRKIRIKKQKVDFSGSEYFKIFAYATGNFLNDFTDSDLGHLIENTINEDSLFIDIGANLGGYSAISNSLGAKVFLFEPVPELNNVLQKNEHFFGKTSAIALSDGDGFMKFNTSSRNIGGSSLVESQNGSLSGYDGHFEVQTKRFDDVFKHEIENNQIFDVVKIDVEGNEFKTVVGMERALEKGLVKSIWCEVRGMSSDRNPGSYITVSKYLENFSYVPYIYNQGEKKFFDVEKTKNCPQYFDLLYLRNE